MAKKKSNEVLCDSIIPTVTISSKDVWLKKHGFEMSFIPRDFPTCLARFLASSSRRPLSTDRCTTFSQRPWTLSRRFLINTTSCFWLKYLRCVPVLSSSMIWSRCEFTSVTNTCRSILETKNSFFQLQQYGSFKVNARSSRWWFYTM